MKKKELLLIFVLVVFASLIFTYPAWMLILKFLDPLFEHPQLASQICVDIKSGEGLCVLGFLFPAFFLSVALISFLISILLLMKKSWRQCLKVTLLIGVVSLVVGAIGLPVKQLSVFYKEILFIKNSNTYAQELVERYEYENEIRNADSPSLEKFNYYRILLEKTNNHEALGDLYVVLAKKVSGAGYEIVRRQAFQSALEHYREALEKENGDSQRLEQKISSLEKQNSAEKRQTVQQPTSPKSSQTPTLFPEADEMVDWKTFSYKGELSFKYPQNWYIGIHEGVGGGRLLNNSDEVEEGDKISFFLEGTEADYGTPDNPGNELLGFMVYGDENVFNNLVNHLVPKPTITTVAGKPALSHSVNIDILIGSLDKRVLHLTVHEGAKPHIDQILSTFNFTN